MTEEKYWEIWDNITEVRFGSVEDMPGDDDEPDFHPEYDERGYADKPWEGPSYDDEDVDLIMGDTPKTDIRSTGDGSDEPFIGPKEDEPDQWESLDIWSKEL